jgi:hypothetical protein
MGSEFGRSRRFGTVDEMKMHELECTLVHETDEAILVTVDGEYEAWLPKSAIEIDRAPGGGVEDGSIVVTAPEQLLIEKLLV